MSSAINTDRKPIAAFVGIDWADKKHDIVLCGAAGTVLDNDLTAPLAANFLLAWQACDLDSSDSQI